MNRHKQTRRDFLKNIGLGAGAMFLSGCADSFKFSDGLGKQPNIILIMADDMGYSDVGCFGSEINTPNLDQLAEDGLRFNRFFNTARCCPSRAALMTGLYPHQAGVGCMDSDLGNVSYRGHIKDELTTLPQMMRQAGYRTIMSGKWHLGTGKGQNPWERGFDRFYGIPEGGGVYFWPPHYQRTVVLFNKDDSNGPVVAEPDEAKFYSTDAFTDYAVEQIQRAQEDGVPFFMYLAYVTPHFPQQAWEKDVQKYLGKYMEGWETLRQKRYQKQIETGIIDPKYKLSEPLDFEWDKLTEKEKTGLDRQMAVYAAQIDNLDQNVGKVMRALDSLGIEGNTLLVFFSDNGGQENANMGFEKNKGTVFGTSESNGGYARGWSKMSNTPFRFYKMRSHFGGVASPFIIRWPEVIKDNGKVREQYCHIIDVFPTCLQAAGLNPTNFNLKQSSYPLEGESLLPYLKDELEQRRRTLYWEHKGNRGVLDGDWKLVSEYDKKWELYNIKDDLTELNDLAEQCPERVEEMLGKYQVWAKRCGVLAWPVKKK